MTHTQVDHLSPCTQVPGYSCVQGEGDHTINLNYLNVTLHVDKCVLIPFTPPIISLIDVPVHDLSSTASLNLAASVSLIPAMDVPGITKLHVL